MTIIKCANWVACDRADTCARCAANYPSQFYYPYNRAMFTPNKPWLCFIPTSVEACEDDLDVSIFQNHANSISIQMDIIEFDLNEIVRTI